jgi:hypothetical protein
MEKRLVALADYVSALEQAVCSAHLSQDWLRYQQHLAATAQMFSTIVKNDSLLELQELVANERMSFGWEHMGSDFGEEAESAFDIFASMVENHLMLHNDERFS